MNFDRFIPNRSAMDFGFARYMLTEGTKVKKPNQSSSPSLYRQKLAEACNINENGRILAFRDKPQISPKVSFSPPLPQPKSSKPERYIPKKSEKVLYAPDLLDDFSLNLLDWGRRNFLSIALENSVFLWNASDNSASEIDATDDIDGPVTSVSWSNDGRYLAVGLNNSHVQIWDCVTGVQVRTLSGGHRGLVGSLAWNNHILTTGGMDGKIVNNDVRVKSHIVQTYKGHKKEVCGLKWSSNGRQLASGGDDNVVCIWDMFAVSSNSATRWLHRFEEHSAAVKALAWSPHQTNLLASGGGDCIKMWNTRTGARLNSVDTGSQVSGLIWNPYECELLSSHGLPKNQLTLWKYPSMVKMAELNGHTSMVLHMTRSPDGCKVATAAADQNLRIWNVFEASAARKTNEPFASFNCIR